MGLFRALMRYVRQVEDRPTAQPVRSPELERLESRRLLSVVFVKDYFPGKGVGGDAEMLAINSTLFFTASDPKHGIELWKSNGKTKGTQMVRDITPGSADSVPQDFVNFEGLLFFTADTPSTGRELWRSDGTTEGTFLVKDINPGIDRSDIAEMTQVGEELFFVAHDPAHGVELWKTNGRSKGTVLVKDILPGIDEFGNQYDSSPQGLVNWNGVLFFRARYGPYSNTVIYKSDGTMSGTTSTKLDYYPTKDTLFLDRHKHTFLVFSDLFIAKTDGYDANTTTVKEVGISDEYNGGPTSAIIGGIIYFATDNDGLWRSDGTPKGTYQVVAGSPHNLMAVGAKLLFANSVRPLSYPLWVSDGTKAGTKVVKRPIDALSGDEKISDLTEVGGVFYCIQIGQFCSFNSNLTSLSGSLNDGSIDFPSNLINVGGALLLTSTGTFTKPGLYRYVPDK
jgi:ELWxxDGT repeat protein